VLDLLAANPLLLLFAVIAVGYPIGRLAVRGVGLGVAAILFAGLAVGALDPRLRLPEVVHLLGLVLFVYSVGLSSGPGFFGSLRRHGARNAALVALTVCVAAGTTLVAGRLAGFDAPRSAGLFAGALTNTPSLAAAVDLLRDRLREGVVDGAPTGGGATRDEGEGREVRDARLAAPVVAYSLAYPLGVLAPILAIALVPRLWRGAGTGELAASREWAAAPPSRAGSGGLFVGTVRATRDDAVGVTLDALEQEAGGHVQPGRVRRAVDGQVELARGATRLAPGDLVTVVGTRDDVGRFTARVGEPSAEQIHLDRRELDTRRIFVSNPAVAGHALAELDLPQQYGAVVTAIRRGDADWVPDGGTVLQLGDRVRVLTRRENLAAVSRFLGDSYRAVSELDVLTFSFGIVLGIAVGLVPVPLPGGLTLQLGLAGGPVVVAMILGALGRTGPLVWGIPYGVNLTLRQIGLILFFAGIGTRSGYAAWDALRDPSTVTLLAVGGITSALSAATVLLAGRYLFRVPESLLGGMIAACTRSRRRSASPWSARGTSRRTWGTRRSFRSRRSSRSSSRS
jgi:putative transport protein